MNLSNGIFQGFYKKLCKKVTPSKQHFRNTKKIELSLPEFSGFRNSHFHGTALSGCFHTSNAHMNRLSDLFSLPLTVKLSKTHQIRQKENWKSLSKMKINVEKIQQHHYINYTDFRYDRYCHLFGRLNFPCFLLARDVIFGQTPPVFLCFTAVVLNRVTLAHFCNFGITLGAT